MLLCLGLCVSCSGSPKVVTVPEVVEIRPPAHLLLPTPVPACSGCETNGDLVEHVLDLRARLRECNADKAAAARSMELDQ